MILIEEGSDDTGNRSTYMMPGIPRFRFPDFSVRVSPVLPRRSGMLCFTALWKKMSKLNIYFASF